MTLWTLTLASIKMYVRNKQAMFFSLFMPFIIMVIFGLLNFDQPPTVRLAVVTQNPTEATEQFITGLDQIEIFDITRGTEEEERAAIAEGDRDLVLFIPGDLLPPDPARGAAELRILTNDAAQINVQTGMSILQQVLNETTFTLTETPTLFVLKPESVDALGLRYIDFLLPGIVAIAVMQMAVFSVAFVFVDYKEKGILKRLIATPMKPYQFVSANVATRLLVAVIQTIILIIVGLVLFKVHVIGSWFLMLLIALLGATMFLGLGFTISGIAKTVETVPAIANLIVFPMFFLGATFFPIENFPDWLRGVVQYLPITHFTSSLRDVMTKGASFGDVSFDLFWMLIWSVVLVGLAIFTFRLEEKRV